MSRGNSVYFGPCLMATLSQVPAPTTVPFGDGVEDDLSRVCFDNETYYIPNRNNDGVEAIYGAYYKGNLCFDDFTKLVSEENIEAFRTRYSRAIAQFPEGVSIKVRLLYYYPE